MGQVPVSHVSHTPHGADYLIIGRGRAALHLANYFDHLGLRYRTWNRHEPTHALISRAQFASHVLLLISDGAVEDFLNSHPWLLEKTCVHFSGRLVSARIPSAHPLMSFGQDLYDLETYQRMSFVLEKGRGSIADLLPGIKNPWFDINSQDKALYHALCVLSGNFTVLLWEKLFSVFESRLSLPKEAALPYLQQITRNLMTSQSGVSVLTGPLTRNDQETIAANLQALAADPYAEVYDAFVSAHLQSVPHTLQHSLHQWPEASGTTRQEKTNEIHS
jgi:hypothetical protein